MSKEFDYLSYLSHYVSESVALVKKLEFDDEFKASISACAAVCVQAFQNGRKVILMGNGGSAADCQHIAGEFVSRFLFDRPGLPAVALTTDTSVLTAIGNDYGYNKLFSRQISAIGVSGDVLIGYSTSGNSANIVGGFIEGAKMGLTCIGFTGARNGAINNLCDLLIKVPSESTPQIQEGHLIAGHALCAVIEERLFADKR